MDETWEQVFFKICDRLKIVAPQKIERWRYYAAQLPQLVASHRRPDDTPTPSTTRKRMRSIISKSNALLKELGDWANDDGDLLPAPMLLWGLAELLDPDDPTKAIMDGHADKAFKDVVSSVQFARQAAAIMEKDAASRMAQGRGGIRHRQSPSFALTFDFLLKIYQQITDRPLGTSWDDVKEEAGGPLVDFLHICLTALGEKKSKAALRADVRRYVETERAAMAKS